jgi:hypothetical protein
MLLAQQVHNFPRDFERDIVTGRHRGCRSHWDASVGVGIELAAHERPSRRSNRYQLRDGLLNEISRRNLRHIARLSQQGGPSGRNTVEYLGVLSQWCYLRKCQFGVAKSAQRALWESVTVTVHDTFVERPAPRPCAVVR